MVRTAVVRSASLAPDEAQLADELADYLAGGSFSQLTQLLLRTVGAPLRKHISDLQASGLDPRERLFVWTVTPPDTEAQISHFYEPSRWPEVSLTDVDMVSD